MCDGGPNLRGKTLGLTRCLTKKRPVTLVNARVSRLCAGRFHLNFYRGNMVNMTMKTLRTWLALWMMAWLPLSGAMAAVMPLQTPAPIQASAANTMDESLPMPCHAAQQDASAPASGACTHCELCHLASALIASTFMQVKASTAHALVFIALPMTYVSHIPELPQRPPSTSLD